MVDSADSGNRSDEGDRLREAPVRRFASAVHHLDLLEEARALEAEHPPSSRGHRQKTLYKHGPLTIAVFVFERDGHLAAHRAAGTVTITVIDGELEVITPEGTALLPGGHVLVLAPQTMHELRSRQRTIMLLGVALEMAPGASA